MRRMKVRLTPEQLRGLDEVAEREGCSRAEVIRRFLDRTILVARALETSEGVRSGLGDLAEGHEKYLADDLAGR